MKKGNRNAMKHGAFAEMILLPGEDREEFEALLAALKDEWDPQGKTQEDRVESLANNMWRKGRARRYNKNQFARFEERMRARERFEQRKHDRMLKVLEWVESEQPPQSQQEFLTKLPTKGFAAYFEKHVLRSGYDTDSAWLEALADKLCDLLSKWHLKRAKRQTVEEMCLEHDGATILVELGLEERLDAKIDKDVTALGRMRTMQAMGLGRRRNGQTITDEPVKQVESPPIQADEKQDKVEKEE